MSRTLSPAATRAAFDQQTAEAFLFRLQIDHPSFAAPLRFINDQVDHTDVGGNTWTAYPFALTLPNDTDEEVSQVTLSIDNVDRQIVQQIRAISGEPTVSLWVVLGSDIDDIVAGPYQFSLQNANWTALVVSGTLGFEPILNLAWPAHQFTPDTAPGMFWK